MATLTTDELMALPESTPTFKGNVISDEELKKLPKPTMFEEYQARNMPYQLGGYLMEKGMEALTGATTLARDKQREEERRNPTPDMSIADTAEAAWSYVKAHPGEALVETVKDLFYNADTMVAGSALALPARAAKWAERGIALAKLTERGRIAQQLARIGPGAASVATLGTEGAAWGGGQAAAKQLAEKQQLEGGEIGLGAALGAGLALGIKGLTAAGGRAAARLRGTETPNLDRLGAEGTPDVAAETPFTAPTTDINPATGEYKFTPSDTTKASSADYYTLRTQRKPFSPEPELKDWTPEEPGLDFPQSRPWDNVSEIRAKEYLDWKRKLAEGEWEQRGQTKASQESAQETAAAQTRERGVARFEDEYEGLQDRLLRPTRVESGGYGPKTREFKSAISRRQIGEIDSQQLAALGITSAAGLAAAWTFAHPDQVQETAMLAAGIGATIASRGRVSGAVDALGPLLAKGRYTLKALDRLPPGRTEFSPAQVSQELGKPGTPAAERAVLEPVLAKAVAENRRVTARELVTAFREATGDFELTPGRTDKYSTNGLIIIRPNTYPEAHTTVWQFPEYMRVSMVNHFDNSRYYGHTRSFHENGIEHVMEIQSDLKQGMRTPLTPEARTAIETEIAGLDSGSQRWRDLSHQLLKDKVAAAIQGKESTAESRGYQSLVPALKNAENRLIRETLGQAAARGESKVRFATADTVNSVEGWEGSYAEKAYWQEIIKNSDRHPVLAEELKAKLDANAWRVDNPESTWQRVLREAEKYGNTKDIRDAQALIQRARAHDALYERYDKDIAKYLKELGGKVVSDSEGNTWWEVPTGIDKVEGLRAYGGKAGQAGPIHMFGNVDPNLSLMLGLGIGGAVLGPLVAGDEKIAAAILGGIAGVAGARTITSLMHGFGRAISPSYALGSAARVSAVVGLGAWLGDKNNTPVEGAMLASALLLGKGFLPAAKHMKPAEILIMARNGNVHAWDVLLSNVKREITSLVPDRARREAITTALDTGSTQGLSEAELRVFRSVRQLNSMLGTEGVDAGVLRGLRENYISHIVERTPDMPESQITEIIRQLFERGNVWGDQVGSGKSRFGKERKYDTITELNQALRGSGLQLKTMDVAEITEIYGKSMRRAIEDRILANSLKDTSSDFLVKMDSNGNLPSGYRAVNNPQFRGYGVHPDLFDSLQAVVDRPPNYEPLNALLALSYAVKRINVTASAFHLSSLAEVYMLGAGSKIFDRGVSVKQSVRAYQNFQLGDPVHMLLQEGVRLGTPLDVHTTIGEVIGRGIDRRLGIQVGEKLVQKLGKAQDHIDYATWEYMHNGGKIALALKEVETLMINNERAHRANPERVPLKSQREICAEVAGYVNDLFGGLDYFKIATEAKTEFGRKTALWLASPNGQKVAQVMSFAPDWALSTVRAFYKAFERSDTGLRGLWRPENATDLYRRYAIRAGLHWLTTLNALNYVASGKSIFENKDPTRITFSDGTTMQAAKHTFEGVHLIQHPTQFVYNKLSYPVKMVADLVLSTFNAGPMAYNREGVGEHLAKSALPFTAMPFADLTTFGGNTPPGEAALRTVMSFGGRPMYGNTPEMQMNRKMERTQENLKLKMQGKQSNGY